MNTESAASIILSSGSPGKSLKTTDEIPRTERTSCTFAASPVFVIIFPVTISAFFPKSAIYGAAISSAPSPKIVRGAQVKLNDIIFSHKKQFSLYIKNINALSRFCTVIFNKLFYFLWSQWIKRCALCKRNVTLHFLVSTHSKISPFDVVVFHYFR